MNKEYILKELEKNSIRVAAKNLSTSYSNLRHWIRVHDIRVSPLKSACAVCGKEILNKRNAKIRTTCSARCKSIGNKSYRPMLRLKRKAYVAHYLGGKCSKCGYDKNLSALDIHHTDPSKKEFQLNATKLGGTDWETVKVELKKCVLLCKNCHSEHHNPQYGDWKSMDHQW